LQKAQGRGTHGIETGNMELMLKGWATRPGVAATDSTNPQSWNRYAYTLNNPLSSIDPSGLECVWDDGSYDSGSDPVTGNVQNCQNQGGTWIELGQLGNWSGQADDANAQLVASIQNGSISGVNIVGVDGQPYLTFYNGLGQTTETFTPSGVNFFNYPNGNLVLPTPQ